MGIAIVLLGILMTLRAIDVASNRSDPQPAAAPHATAMIATHATRGIVKCVDATTLVVTRSAVGGKHMAFVLTPATEREGVVTVGSAVEIRYRTEREQRVATAIRVRERRSSSTLGHDLAPLATKFIWFE